MSRTSKQSFRFITKKLVSVLCDVDDDKLTRISETKQNMAARRDRRKPILPEDIVTESDLQMKELLRKQVETNVTLERQVTVIVQIICYCGI